MRVRHLLMPVSLVVLCTIGLGFSVAGPLTSKGTQPPLANRIIAPGDCGGCHGGYDSGQNLEPWDTWAGSLMAQASRDPLFWAAVDVANHDIPNSGDFCLRCHVPTGWFAGRSEPPGGSTSGCGFEGKLDERDKDLEGVSCHACHRMMVNNNPPVGQDSVYTENGNMWIDDSNCGGQGEPCRRGPYSYPADGSQTPPHAYAFSAYHESSKNCGNCHNVTNPVKTLIQGGVNTGIPFPIERTYKEWQLSSFAATGTPGFKTCQNCHMPDATSNPAYACSDRINNHPGDLPMHRFAGGNSWIPEVLRLEYPNLNLNSELTATRNWALDMLQNQSASVVVSAPDTTYEGAPLALSVRVTNLTGHKLPTGYPEGRRMWLNVRVRDALNNLVFESAAYDPATAVLGHDAQARIYEAKPGVFNHNGTGQCDIASPGGSPLFHFVLNDCIVKDSRIPPLGFQGMSDPETQPVGHTYPETAPGSGILVHYDDAAYVVPIPAGAPSPLSVTATLRYQTVSKDYVDFLLDQAVTYGFPNDCIERSSGFPTQSRAQLLANMWQARGKSAPVDMDTDVQSVVVTQGPLAVGDDGIRGLELRPGRPNPFRSGREPVVIAFTLPRSSEIRLELLDLQGRLVRTLARGWRERGPYSVTWDGRTESGVEAAAGPYFYRLSIGGGALTRKLIVLR